jgi:hypothetical protein
MLSLSMEILGLIVRTADNPTALMCYLSTNFGILHFLEP